MFKFTTRELLLLTLVVALALGWWIDHGSLAWQIANRDPDIRAFKSVVLEQMLRDRGVTVYCPHAGELHVTENGKTRVDYYSW